MLTGQNGILNRAQEAKEKTELAQKDETDKMATMEAMVQTAGTSITNPSCYGTNSNARATADGTGNYFALPVGAKYIEGTVDTGVVIEIKGSEFVWVPVDDVVLNKQRDNELPKTSSDATTNKYTPMAVQDGSNYKGLLYEFSGSNSYLKHGNNKNYQGSDTEYREPDIVSSYDGGDSDTVDGKITRERLTAEYNAMIESVKKYKGFYVARYEAGLDNTTSEIVFKNANLTENNTTTTSANDSKTSSWYGLYKKIKTFATIENNEDKVVSSMIWGSQYDAMMNWMAKTGNEVGTADSTDEKRNTYTVTGKNTKDVINNVYDLYGCHREWTLEVGGTDYRIRRGGYYSYSNSPADRFDTFPNGTISNSSSRATLYIK